MLQVVSRCIPGQPEGIHDDATFASGAPKVVKLAVELWQEGCQAIIVSCAGDPGVAEARQAVPVPVIGGGASTAALSMFYGSHPAVLGITELFSYLLFFVGVGSDLSQLKPESFSKLRGISLQDKLHYCHTQDTIEQTGEIVEEGNPDCVNEFYSVKESLLHRYDRDDRICTERQKRCAVERFGPRAALRICR